MLNRIVSDVQLRTNLRLFFRAIAVQAAYQEQQGDYIGTSFDTRENREHFLVYMAACHVKTRMDNGFYTYPL